MTERILVLLRHAKAETPGDRPDFERRLTSRGESDAGAAGSWLADQGLRPDLVICSPATRTRQTWDGVAGAWDETDPADVRYEPGLYTGGRTEVVDLLRTVPAGVGTVLVIGHNPTMSDMSLLLRPKPDHSWEGLKTAGLAVHRAEGSWSTTEPGSMPLTDEYTARG